MDQYKLELVKQCAESLGMEGVNLENNISSYYLVEWTWQLITNKKEYRHFIESLGVVVDDKSTVELRKGRYDSIAGENTTVISPFICTFEPKASDIVMLDGKPILVTSNLQLEKTYITHNPYSEKYLSGFDYFENNKANICIGAYGMICDKDHDKKIQLLQNYANMYFGSYKEDYTTLDDKYFYALHTPHKVLERVLCRR